MTKTALVFAGQGSQFVGMGRDLSANFPTAANWFERANRALGYDLRTICFDGPEVELIKTEHAQPAIFLLGWIAFQLLIEEAPGVAFHATAGLSLGEFTALAAAGAFDFETALNVVRQRGRFMQQACEETRGAMAAIIGLGASDLLAVCEESDVDLANLNCPGQLVVSGTIEGVARACDLAKAKGARRALPLTVAGAYHSRLMEDARIKLETLLATTHVQSPAVPVFSNVTASPHTVPTDIRAQLTRQVTATVRWEDSIRALINAGFSRFIELGPGTVLSGFTKRIDKNVQTLNIGDVSSLKAALETLAQS